jgi:hypothetical protein
MATGGYGPTPQLLRYLQHINFINQLMQNPLSASVAHLVNPLFYPTQNQQLLHQTGQAFAHVQ